MAGEDFSYYVENMRAFPDCKSFPDDTLSDVLMKRNNPPPGKSNGSAAVGK